jgi:hypothetical protein
MSGPRVITTSYSLRSRIDGKTGPVIPARTKNDQLEIAHDLARGHMIDFQNRAPDRLIVELPEGESIENHPAHDAIFLQTIKTVNEATPI